MVEQNSQGRPKAGIQTKLFEMMVSCEKVKQQFEKQ